MGTQFLTCGPHPPLYTVQTQWRVHRAVTRPSIVTVGCPWTIRHITPVPAPSWVTVAHVGRRVTIAISTAVDTVARTTGVLTQTAAPVDVTHALITDDRAVLGAHGVTVKASPSRVTRTVVYWVKDTIDAGLLTGRSKMLVVTSGKK